MSYNVLKQNKREVCDECIRQSDWLRKRRTFSTVRYGEKSRKVCGIGGETAAWDFKAVAGVLFTVFGIKICSHATIYSGMRALSQKV